MSLIRTNEALHLSALYGHTNTCELLLGRGAKVNAKDSVSVREGEGGREVEERGLTGERDDHPLPVGLFTCKVVGTVFWFFFFLGR